MIKLLKLSFLSALFVAASGLGTISNAAENGAGGIGFDPNPMGSIAPLSQFVPCQCANGGSGIGWRWISGGSSTCAPGAIGTACSLGGGGTPPPPTCPCGTTLDSYYNNCSCAGTQNKTVNTIPGNSATANGCCPSGWTSQFVSNAQASACSSLVPSTNNPGGGGGNTSIKNLKQAAFNAFIASIASPTSKTLKQAFNQLCPSANAQVGNFNPNPGQILSACNINSSTNKYACVPTCTGGRVLDSTCACACQASLGQHWDPNLGSCVTCGGTKIWNATTQSCACPTGTHASGTSCAQDPNCSSLNEYLSTSGTCTPCPTGTKRPNLTATQNGVTACSSCTDSQMVNNGLNPPACTCGAPFVAVNGSCSVSMDKHRCDAKNGIGNLGSDVGTINGVARNFPKLLNPKLACCLNEFGTVTVNGAGNINSASTVKLDCVEVKPAAGMTFDQYWQSTDLDPTTTDNPAANKVAIVLQGSSAPLTGFYSEAGIKCASVAGDPDSIGAGYGTEQCPIRVRAAIEVKCPINPADFNTIKKTFTYQVGGANVNRCTAAQEIKTDYQIVDTRTLPASGFKLPAGRTPMKEINTLGMGSTAPPLDISRIIAAKFSGCPFGMHAEPAGSTNCVYN